MWALHNIYEKLIQHVKPMFIWNGNDQAKFIVKSSVLKVVMVEYWNYFCLCTQCAIGWFAEKK